MCTANFITWPWHNSAFLFANTSKTQSKCSILFCFLKFRGQLARNHFILSLHLRRPVVVLDIPILKSLLLLLAINICYILGIFPFSLRWHKLNKSVFHLLILISWVLSFQPTSSLPIPILLDLFFFFFSGIKLP